MLILAIPTLAAGEYQKARDGKTLVWNANPRAGDEATWFGDRDREGYATGAGTLTWFTAKGSIYARYFGNMAHGKFNGPVNAHSQGKTAHATFVGGERTSRWLAGRAPSRPEVEPGTMVAERQATPTPGEAAVKATAVEARPKIAVQTPVTPLPTAPPAEKIETPAEGPATERKRAADTFNRAAPPPPKIAKKEKTNSELDSSLTSLVGPPSSLHNIPESTQLNQQDVVDLADAEARSQGYDLKEFDRPKADYSATTGKWTLFYSQKSSDGSPQVGKHFVVAVEDKTRKVTVERKNGTTE